MGKDTDFGKILLWIAALLILGWAVLKGLGIISSPIWFELMPYIGGGIGILGVSYKFGKVMKGIEETENKVNKILDKG